MIRPALAFPWVALVAATIAPPLSADDGNFALAFPVTAPAGEPVFAIELSAEAYATLTTSDLADLIVVDATGREQPISVEYPPPSLPRQAPEAFPLPLPIPVPGDASSAPGRLELHVRRDADGRLDALDFQGADGMAAGAVPSEWWIDTGEAAREGIAGLRFTPAGSLDFRTRIDVRGSDDLVHWQVVESGLPVLRASDGGRRIEQLDVRFATTTYRYLGLRPSSGAASLPELSSIQGLRTREAEPPPLASMVLAPVGVSHDGLTIDYGRPGPLPVQYVEVQLTEGDGLIEFRIEAQSDERWQPVASGTAWRLSLGADTLAAAPTPLRRSGNGSLRVVMNRLVPPPPLVLHYAPARILVMANGEPPFRLLAGSARQRHTPAAMADTLDALRQRQGADWRPPLARLGPATPLAGAAALSPAPDPGRLALWAVLALGALGVGGLAWRLLTEQGRQESH